jgi:hypothetical protein
MRLKETLEESFCEFMAARQEVGLHIMISKDERYISVTDRYIELLKMIEEQASTELKNELDNVIAERLSIELDYSYKQGFFDGLQMMKLQNEPIKHK